MKIKSSLFKVLVWIAVVLILIGLVLYGYKFPWTGFGGSKNASGEPIPAKNLWDWLNLLIVPAILALGTLIISSSQQKREKERELNRYQSELLVSTISTLSKMLLEGQIGYKEKFSQGNAVARSLMLNAFSELASSDKISLLNFLYESKLICFETDEDEIIKGPSIISLDRANLTGMKFENAPPWLNNFFIGCNFSGANLSNGKFRGIRFINCAFKDTICKSSDFQDTIFINCILYASEFSNCDFQKSTWTETSVAKINLVGSNIKEACFNDLRDLHLTDRSLLPEGFPYAVK